MNTRTRYLLVVSTLAAPPLAFAADAPEPQQEVIIEATRAYLTKLGKEVVESEHRFYERYNTFNKKREYDVQCDTFAHTETHFVHSDCIPRFEFDAKAAEGQGHIQHFQASSSLSGKIPGVPQGGPPLSADIAIVNRRGDFQKNMTEVIRKNPELQKALEEHAALWKQYEDTFLKLNGRPLLGAKPPEPAVAKPAQ